MARQVLQLLEALKPFLSAKAGFACEQVRTFFARAMFDAPSAFF